MLPLNFADGAARITGVAPQNGAANNASPSPADGAATPSKFADVLKQKATAVASASASASATTAVAAQAASASSADAAKPATAEAPADDAAADSTTTANGAATRGAADAKNTDAAKTRARTTGCIRTSSAPQPETTANHVVTARSDDTDPKAATADATAASAEALAAIKGEPPRLVPIKPDTQSLVPVKGEPVKLVPIKVDTARADVGEASGDAAATPGSVAGQNDAVPKGNDDRTEIGRRVAGRGGRAEGSATPSGKEATASASPFARALAEAGSSHRGERTEPMAATAPVTPAPVQASDAASTVSASVPVPVDSPDFAAALGLQVSVLAGQGVEKAELHLNPAEMGPVSIAISLDGKEARVEFGADLAATRQAIEAGLPELASALRDAGFTLAGGGVSDQASQSGQQGRSGDADASARHVGGSIGRASSEAAKVSEPVRRAVARAAAGGVDLYA